MKAHQSTIRERELKNFGLEPWSHVNVDLSVAVVKPSSYQLTKEIILRYEWLGTMPSVMLQSYGIFFPWKNGLGYECGGVVIYAHDYVENRGVWDKYGYTGKMILLARGACAHWTPKNTASKLIRESMRLLPPKYKVVTATVDANAGEVGTIYQACNFVYTGVMRKNKTRWAIKSGGKIIGSRTVRARVGCQRIDEVRKVWPDATVIKQLSKARYFAFRGSKAETKKNLGAIKHLLKPFPKREEEGNVRRGEVHSVS